MKSMKTVDQIKDLLKSGHKLLLAGSESVIRDLPKGDWIAGTIPYFFTEAGGIKSHELIQTTVLPKDVSKIKVNVYDNNTIHTIPQNYFDNGFSFIVIPAQSSVLYTYARDCSSWNGLFNQPLVGWVSGTDLQSSDMGPPKVFNGVTGESYEDQAVVMHVELKENVGVTANIINMFEQGGGDTLMFTETGFEVDQCIVNGKPTSFSEYLLKNKINMQLPLVANYMGAMINVSFKENDVENKQVSLLAPVFPGVEYRLAKSIDNYESEFRKKTSHLPAEPLFACNCVLNYLYANLEGKQGGSITSAMTFGEIAYMLLNQTMVHIDMVKK